jgi:aryl-alcohol dehydrogenase-like predicted oxidoreductase
MRLRPLGRTGIQVSEIGFGAWGISGRQWIGAREDESLRALHRAIDLGLNFVDTALAYGEGRSETLVGRVLWERRETVFVATKVPPKDRVWPAGPGVPASETYPPGHVVACCEQSLRNLGRDHVDLLQLHTWRDDYLDQDGWRQALAGLKRSGKARFVGASVTEHDAGSALRAAAAGAFDVLQVLYNVFDPRAAEALLPACLAQGVGVLARVPFDEGGLTGTITPETTFPEGDFRNHYFRGERKREVHERAEALVRVMGDEAEGLPELALRFCLSHEAVSAVIPGMRRVANVERNAAVSDGRRLSPALQERLRGHAWPRNFYS